MTPLLLLIDLQRDFLAAAGLEPSAPSVVRSAITLLAACRKAGVPVVHVQTTVSREDDRRMRHWKREGRWKCENGTAGHEPPERLEPRSGEAIIHKNTFNAFSSDELDGMLRNRAVDTLLIAGVHLHACVRQAVLHAYEQHPVEIWVAEDATGSDDPVHAAITRRYLEERTIRFLPVREIVARLAGMPVCVDGDDMAGIKKSVRAAAVQCAGVKVRWRDFTLKKRAEIFESLALRLEADAADLAESMAREIGKPVRYGRMEVRRSAQMLGAIVRRIMAEHGMEKAGGAEIWRRELGIVALLTPWNNPVYIPLGKLAPALLLGNAVLWKPAPQARTVSARLMELLHDAGLPSGLVALVQGGRRSGEAVMSDPAVAAVSLTGSLLAGFSAQEICARRHLPLQAELGGNNAAIVWPDADLQDAAHQIADGAFAMTGQRCTANRRVVVHEDRRKEFLDLLVAETAALAWGDPMDLATTVGPLVSADSRDRIAALVDQAERDGCRVIVPHAPQPAPSSFGFQGAWHPPTIVCCDDPSLEIVQYESFGPILVVQTARDLEHALTLANGVCQGLAAALFSNDPQVIAHFKTNAAAGILKINRSTADADVDVPFGGWKSSGIGPPEHGIFDRDFYTRPQTCYPSPPQTTES